MERGSSELDRYQKEILLPYYNPEAGRILCTDFGKFPATGNGGVASSDGGCIPRLEKTIRHRVPFPLRSGSVARFIEPVLLGVCGWLFITLLGQLINLICPRSTCTAAVPLSAPLRAQ